MRLIIVGCEYTGKTSLVKEIVKWWKEKTGVDLSSVHDHFTFPSKELPEDEREKLRALGPKAKEQFQRYQMEYHLMPFSRDDDIVLIGFHIEEAVYAPLYYGYGGKGEYTERSNLARYTEKVIAELNPETVLVLLKASPETIRRRMKEHPNPQGVVQEKDIEHILKRFQEEYNDSLLRRKIEIDTTDKTVEQTFKEFTEAMKHGSCFTMIDLLRLNLAKT